MSYTKELVPSWHTTEDGNKYEVRPLSALEYLKVMPHIKNKHMTGEGVELTLRDGVLDWKNPDKEFTKSSYKEFFLADQIDLAQHIMTITEASEEKIKN